MDTLLQDSKLALRMFWQSPSFAITAVAALALGIGATVAIFSVVNAVLLKPVAFPEPDRLVMLVNTYSEQRSDGFASPSSFMHWRTQTDVLEDIAAFNARSFNYTAGDALERVRGSQVSEAYFRAFRAPIIRGRAFAPSEDLPNAPRVTVVSHRFWTQRLGADPEVIGETVLLNGEAYTIVGIAGPDFDLREFGDPDLWVPSRVDPNTTAQGAIFQVVARLKPGVTLEQAHARIAASTTEYRERFPNGLLADATFGVRTLQDAVIGPGVRATMLVLLGAVGFVLLIACANVASLMLMRATGRRQEMALRTALGAGRARIARQLLTESILLAAAGGALGLGAGVLGMRALLAVNTAGLPRLGDAGSLLGLDWRVVSFTVAAALVTAALFGLAPALVASRPEVGAALKDTGGRSGSGYAQSRARAVVVVLEVALAVVLLIGAALLIRTFLALGDVRPGFNADNVLVVRTSLTEARFATTDAVARVVRAGRDRIRETPGVVDATFAQGLPIEGPTGDESGEGLGLPFTMVGRAQEGPFTGLTGLGFHSPGLFDVLGIPVLRGRDFDDRDDGAALPVVVINEAFARRFLPDGTDPLLEEVLLGGGRFAGAFAEEPVRRIIGVVGDVRHLGLASEPLPMLYVPQAQMVDALHRLGMEVTPAAWIVRTRGEPLAVAAAVKDVVQQVTGTPVTDVQTMAEVVAASISRQRLRMLLMSVFGGSAFLLAAIGIYGLLAHAVQQRTREIGLRMALGAQATRLKRMVLRQGMALIATGLGLGLAVAFVLADLLASFLFGVEPRDIAVFVIVPIVLGAVALVAILIPASRASSVNPLDALRHQ